MNLPKRLVITGPPEHTNPVNSVDTNNDGSVTGADALLVINELARMESNESQALGISQFTTETGWRFLDVNADDRVSAGDALRVINQLHRQNQLEQAEGESFMLVPELTKPTEGGLETSRLRAWEEGLSSVLNEQEIKTVDWETASSQGSLFEVDYLEPNAIDEWFKDVAQEKPLEFEADQLWSLSDERI
jgi:hypothetical protein